jgi:hypothetical protein
MTRVNEDWGLPVCRRCFERGHEAKDCKEPEENFGLIGLIAAFIGARLQYPCPMINGQGNPWMSTISVDQHKEKFWYARVYCDLADPDLVKKKWDWLRDRQIRINAGEKFYDRLHSDVIRSQLTEHVDPTPEFFARCVMHDAIHYRKVYMDAVKLRPHLRERICDQADHWTLLLENPEQIPETKPEHLEWTLKKFHLKDQAELPAFFKKVYNPSFRDAMELRD